MPLTRVGLTITTAITDNCSKITSEDTTGLYNVTTNPLGYGLPGGIAFNDIITAVYEVYYPSITIPITYTLTYAAGTVTALTVKDLNNVSYNIFADLATLMVDGVFDLTGTDAFTLPTITDGMFNVVYTISGTNPEVFTYTTNSEFLSTCSIDCCISKMYLTLDMECSCSDAKKTKIMNSEIFLNAAKYAIQVGQDSKAQGFLDKAIELCEDCGGCSDC